MDVKDSSYMGEQRSITTPEIQRAVLRSSLGRAVALPDDAWSAAEGSFIPHHFAAGEHVIESGSPVSTLFFITSGVARYYYLDDRGREFNKAFSTVGQVLSSVSSLVSGAPAPFSIQALSPSDCLAIPYDAFLALAGKHAFWSDLRIHLLEQLVIKKERREADFLLLSPTERYQQFLRDYAPIAESVSNYHIASYIGVTEVALSRIRRRLGLTRVNAGTSGGGDSQV